MDKFYLNHKLEDYNSNMNEKLHTRFDCYKCAKCNLIIFYYNESDMYWRYANGLDFGESYSNWSSWQSIELTCEEEQIKMILE